MKARKTMNRHTVNRHGLIRRLAALICACAMVIIPFTGVAIRANAAEGTANLKVTWDYEGIDLVIYKVADRNSNGSYELTEDFEDYGVEVTGIDEEELESAAQLLAIYATRDNLKALDEYTSDTSGEHTFADLEYGGYMVFNKATATKNSITTVPVFIFLEKDMEVMVKPMEDLTTSCEVYKIWDDSNSKNRPESIVIQLLKGDGTVYKEETLSEKNNWHCEWKDLPEDKYRVVEKTVPSGYKLTASRRNTTWKLTNKKKDTPPDDEDTPSGGEKTPPDSSKKIPQTGQLWWPVGVLLSAGFLCMIIGLLRRRKAEKGQEMKD